MRMPLVDVDKMKGIWIVIALIAGVVGGFLFACSDKGKEICTKMKLGEKTTTTDPAKQDLNKPDGK